MDKLIVAYSLLLRWIGLQTSQGLGFPCIATLKFTMENHLLAKSAIHAGRKNTLWLYGKKYYRVTGIKINGKYLEIHGYPLDTPTGNA